MGRPARRQLPQAAARVRGDGRHDATHHPGETVYLGNCHRPIATLGENDEIIGIDDWRAMKAIPELSRG